MNNPRDRPTIPRGMLQPAPPPKAKGAPAGAAGSALRGQGERGKGGSPYTGVVTAHHTAVDVPSRNVGVPAPEGKSKYPATSQGKEQEAAEAVNVEAADKQQPQQGGWGSTLAGWWAGKNTQQHQQSQSQVPDSASGVRASGKGNGDVGDGFEIPLPPASARQPPPPHAGDQRQPGGMGGGSVIPPVRSRTLAPQHPSIPPAGARSQEHTRRGDQARAQERQERQGSVLDDIMPAYGGYEMPAQPGLRAGTSASAFSGVGGGGGGTGGGAASHAVPTAGLGLGMPTIPGASAGAGSSGGGASASASARGHRVGWGAGVEGDLRTAATGGRAGIGAGGGKWADRLRSRR